MAQYQREQVRRARAVEGAESQAVGEQERLVAEGEAAYERAAAERAKREQEREEALAEAKRAHEDLTAKIVAQTEARNAEVDAFRMRFEAGEAADVVEYFSLVLDASRH